MENLKFKKGDKVVANKFGELIPVVKDFLKNGGIIIGYDYLQYNESPYEEVAIVKNNEGQFSGLLEDFLEKN